MSQGSMAVLKANVKRRVEQIGRSLESTSRKCGMDSMYLRQIIQGHNCGLLRLDKVAGMLGVPTVALLTEGADVSKETYPIPDHLWDCPPSARRE